MTIAEYIRQNEINELNESIEAERKREANFTHPSQRSFADRFQRSLDFIKNIDLNEFKRLIGTPDKNNKSFLDIEFKSVEVKTGKGGKKFYSFNDNVNFFPSARFGWYASVGM